MFTVGTLSAPATLVRLGYLCTRKYQPGEDSEQRFLTPPPNRRPDQLIRHESREPQ